jgi:hypothetical protein
MAALVGAAVYGIGRDRCTPARPDSFTAIAYVIDPSGSLDVNVQIPMAYTDRDRHRAEEVANALARQYVEDRHTEWQQSNDTSLSEPRDALEKAKLALAENEQRFEAFRTASAARSNQSPTMKQDDSRTPAMTENPEWLDLNHKLFLLKQRRDEMLVDRTPLHPTVQELGVQINDLRAKIASVPRQISPIPSGRVAETESREPTKPDSNSTTVASHRNEQRLTELTAAVESSRQALSEAEEAERKALAQQPSEPPYSVLEAEIVDDAATSDYGWRRLLVTALMTGFTMAFGFGTLTSGTATEPPVGTISQIRKAARAPVLGMICTNQELPDTEQISRRQTQQRRLLISIGLTLIALSPAIAYWGLAGI